MISDHVAGPAATPRVLLVAPANSYRTFAYLDAARRLGLDLFVASEGEHSLVNNMVGGIRVDLRAPDAVDRLINEARRRPFHGVVATDDASVELTSRVARALGLPHNPPAAAQLSRRKDLARACLAAAGLPVPRHWVLNLRAPLGPQLDPVTYPCVAKPLALSASRGVIRADSAAELGAACARIQRILELEASPEPDERDSVLVEAFISGPEVALEGLLHHGELRVLALFDKPDPMEGPFFEETYYITPSRLPEADQRVVRRRVAEACAAYGLREGPVHAELRISGGDAWIMEIASRTIGGECARLLKFGTGHRLEDLVLAQAVGRRPAAQAPAGGGGVLMIPIPKAGVLRRVEGVLAARRVPYIEDLQISMREGYELVPLPEGSRYLGFVFAQAPTAADVEQALRAAHARLNIVVAPLFTLSAG